MSISGYLKKAELNRFGYTRISVNGVWYGADAKGDVPVKEGDFVTFEDYKNDKGYATFKKQSIKIAEKPANASADKPAKPAWRGGAAGGGARDSYWEDKAKSDAAKEPRIAYFAALERAIQFVNGAFAAECLPKLTTAKGPKKLGVYEAFVAEYTQKFMNESAVAKFGEAAETTPAEPEDGETDEPAEDPANGDPNENWG